METIVYKHWVSKMRPPVIVIKLQNCNCWLRNFTKEKTKQKIPPTSPRPHPKKTVTEKNTALHSLEIFAFNALDVSRCFFMCTHTIV